MEEWIKIYSFESQYQAEMTKDILAQKNVKSVIVNTKDSLFMIGDYELYVTKDNEKMAQAILDEYRGLTKVDSFVMRGPIERLKDVLEDNGISSEIKVSRNPRYQLDNYELYVDTKDVKAVAPFVTGKGLTGWSVAKTCVKTQQARYRVEILNYMHIPCIIIKKRDTKYMKTELALYVKDEHVDQAREALETLPGYSVLETAKNWQMAEIHEKMLTKQGICTLIEDADEGLKLYVENGQLEDAEQLLKENKKWKLAGSYTSQIEADYAVALLENFEIEAVAVPKNDITLAIDIDLYVEEFDLDDATDILQSLNITENE